MRNSVSHAKKSSDINDRRSGSIGTLIPPLFGTGCDVWSPPPTRASSILCPNWKRTNEFIFTNSILNENSPIQSSTITKLLMNPLAVCAPSMVLLSKEHLQTGIWHSASTPDLDGKLVTSWSSDSLLPNDSEGTSIGIQVTKLFPMLKKQQQDIEALFGVDLRFIAPTENSNERNPSGRIHAFYHLALNRKLGSVALSATVENMTISRETFCQGIGIHYNNTLAYAWSKPLLINLGVISQFSGLCPIKGSTYVICNSLSDGCHAGVQADIHLVHERAFHQFNLGSITQRPFVWSYLLSFDLNRINKFFSKSTSHHSQLDSPIVLSFHNVDTIENDISGSSCDIRVPAITVSQYIPIERIIFNPLEDRCPQIRNTLSWALQIRQPSADISKASHSLALQNSNQRPTLNVFRAAAAWQMNRNLCTKLHFDTRDGLTMGIIIKRWAQPRLTVSILFCPSKHEQGATRRFGFKGLGLQIETGPLATEKSIFDANEFLYRVDAGMFRSTSDYNHGKKPQAPTMIEYQRVT